MKNLLLATTALIASATIANAQAVTISGEGRMGVIAFHGPVFGVWSWAQENQLSLDFNVAIEADHGLSFGALTTAEIANGSVGVFSGSSVWVEANGLTLTFGNTPGAVYTAGLAVDTCLVGYEGGTICGDDAGADLAFVDSDTDGVGPANVTAAYAFGDTTVAVSHERTTGETEVAAMTSFDAFTVAAGYTTFASGIWTVSGHYDGGSWGVGALVVSDGSTTNYTVSGNVALYGGALYGYVGREFGGQTYGLSYGYDLGGGATLTAGVEHWDIGAGATSASMGVAFTF
ncbi:hypothetical protein JI664_16405 [Rhodobacter sp. NTK016B]|uniref:hypothetical protein n=1 Tax=Rhodobacter sp. NTK016B TaxID=2759676 RepID=UPI001A90AFE1|nr:hypothetical protein [Rhodobacter sp. NTK016B]MBN8293555.1 hypothetical protein [Rhodobacter sp. NTK016B]